MKKTLLISLSIIGVFGFGTFAYALPYFSQTQSMIPGSDTVNNNLGTTSPSNLRYNGFFKNVNISGTCTGCASSAFEIATTTDIVISGLSYFTKTSGRTTLGSVATTSLTASGVVSLSNPISVIGASASAITLTGGSNGQVLGWLSGIPTWTATTTFSSPLLFSGGNVTCQVASGSLAGCLSSADWTTFNSKLSSYNAFTNPTGTFATTTSALSLPNGGLIGFMGNATVDTSNYSLFGNTTLTLLNARSGASIGFRIANADVANFTTTGGYAFGSTYYNLDPGQNKMIVESSLGVGTSTPGTLLSIGGSGTGINFVDGATATSTFSGHVRIKGNLQVDGKFFAPVTLVSSGNTTINGDLTVTGASTLATSLTGVGVLTSGVVSAVGAQTCTNQFVRAMSAGYVATCATVGASDVSLANLTATDTSLTFSGTYTGATARTIGLNLGNANTWTGLQQFTNASSTQFSVATETFYINSAGRVTAKDTTNGWSGVSSPTRSFVLSSATTTTWTASTTGSAYSPYLVMPFAGTLRQVRCTTDASFLGVNTQIAGSNVTPSYFVASTTVGKIGFTANNTFTAGQKILANFGTTTTSGSASISCTYDVTED